VPKTNFRKQNPESIKELVKNYNELKIAFSRSKWQEFFVE